MRAAAVQVFEERSTHAFPPTVQFSAKWKPELEVLAKELGYPTTSATEIESHFGVFVDFPEPRPVDQRGKLSQQHSAHWHSARRLEHIEICTDFESQR